MKTITVAVAALLASTAVAQPHHGHHVHQKKDLHKRKYETEWVTETLTATLLIDEHGTSLYEPSPGQFYPSTTSEETTSTSTSTSTSEPDESTTTTPEPEPTTTSIYVEQEPTTPEAVNTPTTTVDVPVYTPTTAEAAQPTYESSSGGASYSGDITWYDLGLTACGKQLGGMTPSGLTTSDPAVVALARSRFTRQDNPNKDPLCGQLIKITTKGGSGYGQIWDICEGCLENDIDVNHEAFNSMNSGDGRGDVSWSFM